MHVSNASTRQARRPRTLEPNSSPRLSPDGHNPTQFEHKSRPGEFPVGVRRPKVLDDFASSVPVNSGEIEVLEIYLGDALDQFLGCRTNPAKYDS